MSGTHQVVNNYINIQLEDASVQKVQEELEQTRRERDQAKLAAKELHEDRELARRERDLAKSAANLLQEDLEQAKTEREQAKLAAKEKGDRLRRKGVQVSKLKRKVKEAKEKNSNCNCAARNPREPKTSSTTTTKEKALTSRTTRRSMACTMAKHPTFLALGILLVLSPSASGYKCFHNGKCQESATLGKGCVAIRYKDINSETFRSVSSEICRREFFDGGSCIENGLEDANWRRIRRSREMRTILEEKTWPEENKMEICCCWEECCNKGSEEPIFKAVQGSQKLVGNGKENKDGVWAVAAMASGLGLAVLVVVAIVGSVIQSKSQDRPREECMGSHVTSKGTKLGSFYKSPMVKHSDTEQDKSGETSGNNEEEGESHGEFSGEKNKSGGSHSVHMDRS